MCFITAMAGMVSNCQVVFADCAPAPTGLIGWWPGDGNANDIASTNHGTLQGGATTTNAYMIGQAFRFNGTNAYLQIPDSPSLKPTNLTVECFVLFNSLNSPGSGAAAGVQYIVFKQNTRSSSFEGFDLGKTRVGTNDVFRFAVSSAAGQTVSLQSSTLISTGVWYHVAGVRGSNYLQLYVNGALERETNVAFAQNYGNLPLYFGTSGQPTWDRKFSGLLEEVTLYNRALSASEISSIYYAYGWGKCKAPSITLNPQSATLPVGSSVTFTVAANGVGTLSYRWLSNGILIPGATGQSYSLSNLQVAASADYSAVVTNALGSAASAAATLAVYPPPSMIVNVDVGDGPFGVKTGPAALGHDTNDFWNHLLGAGTVANAKTARSNATLASVTVPYGMNNWLLPQAASGDPMRDDYLAWLSGISPVTISDLPSGNYDFYLYSHDGTFQLSVGNVNYGTKTAFESFPLANPPVWTEGRQFVSFHNIAVTNGGSPVTIGVGRFLQPDAIIAGMQIVRNSPWIFQQPSNTFVAVESNVVLQVAAEAAPPLAFQWFFNNTLLANGGRVTGATNDTLVIANSQLADTGGYFVVVTNSGGATTSLVATVQVGLPPSFAQSPSSQTNLAGTTAQFSAQVNGGAPIALRWLLNGNPLANDAHHSGTTTTNLTVSAVAEMDEGGYVLVASNVFGVVTSAVAMLTVQSPPSVTSQPANQYVLLTDSAAFSVGIAGDLPVSYQWYFGSTPLAEGGRFAGTTTSLLTIQNVQTNDVGSYTVIVSNAWGSATSAAATLNLPVVRYVNVSNSTPVSPYTNWATAATNIQLAINAAMPNDTIMVTNGTYQAGDVWPGGSFVPNRIAINKPVIVVSVNGPAVTSILGNDATGFAYSAYGRRCAYLTNGAMLSGFTLSAGRADLQSTNPNDQKGGGVLCASVSAVVSNCIITGNFAGRQGGGSYSGTLLNCVITDNQAVNLYIGGVGEGGGAYASDLRNCLVSSNRTSVQGGGAHLSTLINCTVVGNSATTAGGVSSSQTTNSIVYYNSGNSLSEANYLGGTFDTSCTAPASTGSGNITNEPAFANLVGANFRLQSGSPCINAGNNTLSVGNIDLDGNQRVVDGLVDIGAYEFQHVPSIVSPPISQTVLLTSNVVFSVYALGDEPLSYQWQKDGVNLSDAGRISGAGTPSLAITNLLLQDAGDYRVIVANASGSVTSIVATLTLFGLPTISVQPVSRTVPAGTNVSFSVTASGLATLSYQWRFNQSDLTGKTNSLLSLTNVQAANAGDYDVVVANIYGAVTSSVATLTVLPAVPIITTQAVSRVASVGHTVLFAIAAKGSEPMTCQWQKNGIDLPGENSFTLVLNNVNSSTAGTYRAAISNAYGFAFSTNVTLVVSPVLVWGLTNAQQIQGAGTIPPSATNVMAIAAGKATDAGTPCFALRADGTLLTWGGFASIPANTTNVVAIAAGGPGSRAGDNNVALLGNGNVVHWTLTGNQTIPPAITNGGFVAVAAGATHQLALRDNGTVLSWGTYSSGPSVLSATNVPISVSNVIAIAAGIDVSLALQANGTVAVWGNNVNLNQQIAAFSNIVNITGISAGGAQVLGLKASREAVGYCVTNPGPQVTFYGGPPAGATNMATIATGFTHSLALRSDGTVFGWGNTNFGQLNIPPIATNVVAVTAGNRFSLALVHDPFASPILPRIARPPLGRVLKTGDNVVFNALAVGGLPLHYQWLHNGAPVAGQTNTWLALPNAHPSEAGDYQLVATNDFGAVTSAVAVVTVGIPQPALKFPVRYGNAFSFTLNTVAGVYYASEFKNDLPAASWTEFDHRLGAGEAELIVDTNAVPQTKFYRVRTVFPPPP